jgi:hypothetical protein
VNTASRLTQRQSSNLARNNQERLLASLFAWLVAFRGAVRIPMKPAMHSNMKPATYSDPKPARIPI